MTGPDLLANLQAYKRKYYLNKALRGTLIYLLALLGLYFLFSGIEYVAYLPSVARALLLFGFLAFAFIAAWFWIVDPLWARIKAQKQLSDFDAAQEIGWYFPEIKDKLINALQLSHASHASQDLLKASILQKSLQLSVFDFSQAVVLGQNKKYAQWLVLPLIFMMGVLFFAPEFYQQSNHRIFRYQEHFEPQAPFQFHLLQKLPLKAFHNEDLTIELQVKGSALPEEVYFLAADRKIKMVYDASKEVYSHTLTQLQENQTLQFEGAGFLSPRYEVEVYHRPVLQAMEAELTYPAYLKRNKERLQNEGSFTVPIGTKVAWKIKADHAEMLTWTMLGKSLRIKPWLSNFTWDQTLMQSGSYEIVLQNDQSQNKDLMRYAVQVIPDEMPSLTLQTYQDTLLYDYIILGGAIADDHGFSQLQVHYRKSIPQESVERDKIKKAEQKWLIKTIPFKRQVLSQSFFSKWTLDSLQPKPGEVLEYYVQVSDNDGVHGPKSVRSSTMQLSVPSLKDLNKEVEASAAVTEQNMDQTLKKAEDLKKEMKKLDQKLKTKRTFDWQDKKAIEELLEKHKTLQKELEQVVQQHQQLLEQQKRFDIQKDPLAEKAKQLQALMNEILDDETKKMYDQLAKLLQEQNKENQVKDLLEEISKKDKNIEKELDRALEMFKQLKFDQKLDQEIDRLKALAEKEEKLAQKATEKQPDALSEKKAKEENQKQQEAIKEEFKEAQKGLEDLKAINESLENKKEMSPTEELEKEIEQSVKEGEQEGKEGGDSKKEQKAKKKAAEKMKELSDQLAKMQQKMESKELDLNIASLRDILENLLKLSFDQEEVMKDFRNVNNADPRFVTLSQKQLKLKDDAKIIEDSLQELAKKAFQIQSFVTKELDKMNQYMDESSVAIKQRRPDIATGKQQFAMTSINNLALLLNEVLKQMMEDKMDSSPGGASCNSKKKKKGGKSGGKLSDLQKKLNQQIEGLKKSGMSGKQLSEELGKLAQQQEQIRNALKEEEGKMPGGKEGGKKGENEGADGANGKKAKEAMEKSETELVNKRLTEELIHRQQDILTRLLEHENAQRERELDKEREAEKAKDQKHSIPPSFEQYLKAKEKQVELLKTIVPNLSPYYKEQAQEYFQRLQP